MASVSALVLTRNRKDLLLECIAGLDRQTEPVERILIIDNASDDGTEELLRERGIIGRDDVIYERLDENAGGAGGYAHGIALGLKQGTDWLWTMDDDAEPRPDALERLISSPPASEPDTVALAGAVVNVDGSIDLLHRGYMGRFMRMAPREEYERRDYPDLGFSSFVGLLVRTDRARSEPPPPAEFFIGCDDVEYTTRLRRHGRIRLVPDSHILHKLVMGGGEMTRRARALNVLLGADYRASSWRDYWKNLYAIRNFFWIRHHHGHVSPLGFAGMTAAYVAKSAMYDDRPLRRLPWIVRYAWKGRRGDFTGPTPDEWREMACGGPT
jgi:rhamnopyranosyl-N-acetylglucosaminyl-diphospho-decaprenol beta-1,3/1,4-galactofuranosyltransferase